MAIQIRRGTDAQWEAGKSNIVVGEPAVTTDTERAFIGTGSGTYVELATKAITNGTSTTYSFDSVSVPSDTPTQIGTAIDIPTGTWIVTVTVRFASNANGYRKVHLASDTSGTTVGNRGEVILPPTVGNVTSINLAYAVRRTSNPTTYYLFVTQNSGSNITVNARAAVTGIAI